jgi:hypothetical protein
MSTDVLERPPNTNRGVEIVVESTGELVAVVFLGGFADATHDRFFRLKGKLARAS